jgi:hypothetical protein
MTSRGAALRFILTLLALVQTRRKEGDKARLIDFGFEVAGTSRARGWADLIAPDAVDSNSDGVFLSARDKRARSVRNALGTLTKAGLVNVPGPQGQRDRFEKFALLNERGVDVVGEAEEYRVPKKAEPTFTMPGGFVKHGWLHVLEDSEIALLLMVACAKEAWWEGGLLVVPAEIRLRNYGIHRDAYSAACKTLEWFGLLTVKPMGRHEDGRAEQGVLQVHRLGLVHDGFEVPAVKAVADTLKLQLSRH